VADASTSILSKGAPAWIDVDSVRYYRHEKMGSAPSIRVEYVCGFVVHKEWICLSHQGFAHSKAEQWWQRCGATPVPRSTDEGLARTVELRAPVQIQIRPSGKYFEIVGRRFEARKQEVAA
jgi:DNA repair protein RadD